MKNFDWSVKLDPRTKDAIDAARSAYPVLTNKALIEAMVVTCARLLKDDQGFVLDKPFWHETPRLAVARRSATDN